ncbi:MAG: hypothetical protein R2734_11680 [Nocardioides sp.]
MTGRSRRAKERVDLADVTEAALVPGTPARAGPRTFRADLAASPVVGDGGALEQAVTNLLDNAAKGVEARPTGW